MQPEGGVVYQAFLELYVALEAGEQRESHGGPGLGLQRRLLMDVQYGDVHKRSHEEY